MYDDRVPLFQETFNWGYHIVWTSEPELLLGFQKSDLSIHSQTSWKLRWLCIKVSDFREPFLFRFRGKSSNYPILTTHGDPIQNLRFVWGLLNVGEGTMHGNLFWLSCKWMSLHHFANRNWSSAWYFLEICNLELTWIRWTPKSLPQLLEFPILGGSRSSHPARVRFLGSQTGDVLEGILDLLHGNALLRLLILPLSFPGDELPKTRMSDALLLFPR